MAGILPITIMMMTASCSSDNENIQEPQPTGRTIYVEIPAENTTETRAALGESVEGKRYYTFAEGDNLQISGTISGSGQKFYSVASSGSSTPAPFKMESKSADGKSAVFSGYVYFEDGTSDMTSTFATFEATLLPDGWETFGNSYFPAYFYTINNTTGQVAVSHDAYCNWTCPSLNVAYSRYAWLTHSFENNTLAAKPINLICRNAFLNVTINGVPNGNFYTNGRYESNDFCQGGFFPIVATGGVVNFAMAVPAGVNNIKIITTAGTLTLPAEKTTEAGKIYNITRNYIDLDGGGKE